MSNFEERETRETREKEEEKEEISFVDSLTEDEKEEIYMTITELSNDYLTEEIVKMVSPTFIDDYCSDITHILFQELLENEVCKEHDYDDLYDIVSEIALFNLESCGIPLRSEDHSIDEGTDSRIPPSKITALRDQPQPAQRTPEWYAFRQGVITASNIGKIFASDAQLNSFIYEKCKNIPHATGGGYVNTESSLHWGVKYEPLTCMLYEYRNKTKVGEFGCIRHSTHTFLAASPDGINVDPASPLFGRMLEIKNIVNREIDGVPSPLYWVQMQMQMECCDLDECDFVETRFKEYASAEEFYADDTRSFELGEKGAMIAFTSEEDGSPIYKYLSIGHAIPENTALEEWTNLIESYIPENTRMKSIIFWYLDEYSCVLVRRNRAWFDAAMPKIQETWDIIQKEKTDGFEHRAPKKKQGAKPPTGGLLFQIDENGDSHVIQNMPITNSFSVIKTDVEDA
jgi:putative phage-type endonuclease